MRTHVKLIIIVAAIAVLVGGVSGAVFGVLGSMISSGSFKLPRGLSFGNERSDAPSPLPPATAEEASTVAVIDRANPAVVSIVLFAKVSARGIQPSPFEEFFGFPFDVLPQESGASREVRVGGGSGFIVSGDGYILTNRHVVDEPEARMVAATSDGTEYAAKMIAVDPVLDLAVVKIEAQNLPTVPLGDSDRVRVGETVIAIGNALATFQNTVTKGIVSGLNRRIVAGDARGQSEVIEDAIQTDAAINPGNSGGPLVNLRGEVIGIATAVERPAQGVGFAIPINIAKRAVDDAKTLGRITRARLGVRYVMVDKEVQEKEKLTVDHGALVVGGGNGEAIVRNSPAAKAGVLERDVIVSLDGVAVDLKNTLAKLITRHRPGDTVALELARGAQKLILRPTLDEFPSK